MIKLPSLMPGTAGAKEVYAIAVIREDSSIAIPPEALDRFEIRESDLVLLTTSHPGEAGFGLISSRKARGTVLEGLLDGVTEDRLARSGKKRRVLSRVRGGRLGLLPDALEAFGLRKGDKLLVIKGAAAAMAYVPVEIWQEKLAKKGFDQAIRNIGKLREI
jgi:hypothetical protein